MLLLGKTQTKHMGDLPPTVPELPLHPTTLQIKHYICATIHKSTNKYNNKLLIDLQNEV